MRTPEGTPQLLRETRTRFILAGSSLKAWCDAHGVNSGYASVALDGRRNGPKAKALRARILAASHDASAPGAPAQRSIRRAV
ncbi:MAG: hypothetical protein KIS81_00815 [Maricaulaceae bacterium]|nr:hypothetical protein [Maricaulaceae bacterium]